MQIKVQNNCEKIIEKNGKTKKNEKLNESENCMKNCDLLKKKNKIKKA